VLHARFRNLRFLLPGIVALVFGSAIPVVGETPIAAEPSAVAPAAPAVDSAAAAPRVPEAGDWLVEAWKRVRTSRASEVDTASGDRGGPRAACRSPRRPWR
jgi:hypothetical protein